MTDLLPLNPDELLTTTRAVRKRLDLDRPVPLEVVQEVLQPIRSLNERGMTILLVEQNVAVSLKISDRAYVLENGRVVMRGSGDELLRDDRVRQAYLGL